MARRQASGSRHCDPTWDDRPQQGGGFVRCGAELARQIDHGAAFGQGDTQDQAAAFWPGRLGLVQDFRQFAGAVEHEVAHGVTVPGLADGGAGLHRVHEVDVCLWEHGAHQGDFAGGGAVEVTHAAAP